MIKRVFEYALMGAGMCIGYLAVKTVSGIVSDPYKKAEIKRKIKDVFTKKD